MMKKEPKKSRLGFNFSFALMQKKQKIKTWILLLKN
ncbi:hypothetical protein FIC_01104 [Flavobacteriaceae bacterium 3519-10]|nr:hypothetical protein FIC_01104 [Flavobacteriaceae bacterium 3519-10]